MAHRLFSIPMTEEKFLEERKYIFEVGKVNGFTKNFISKIMKKHETQKYLRDATTLLPVRNSPERRISVPFYPTITNQLRNVLRKHDIELLGVSNETLKTQICNYKDKQPALQNSGIYSIGCKDCDAVYIGQTRRRIETRTKEHVRHTKHKNPEGSSVAEHMIDLGHSIDEEKIKVVRGVQKINTLDAWESLFIKTSEAPLMNKEDTPINSSLFYLSSLKVWLPFMFFKIYVCHRLKYFVTHVTVTPPVQSYITQFYF